MEYHFEKIFKSLDELKTLMNTSKNVLNIDEVCALTSLSKSTIYKLTMTGKIPHFKQAKHLYFDSQEIETWLKENRGYNVYDEHKNASEALVMRGKGGAS